ncbi:MAG: formate dehydrogenase subunit alpha [Firmicutes bacterium]|nr:formate dehydrogenase subunit alpha [Bacillota bacterium]
MKDTGDLAEFILDGTPRSVPTGTLLLEAARRVGIDIPTLCHHPELSVQASCRLCVVEIEGRGLVTSCNTPVAAGMVVLSRSSRVVEARRTVLDLMLSNHPNDCLVCHRAGDCRLQDYAYEYGANWGRFPGTAGAPGTCVSPEALQAPGEASGGSEPEEAAVPPGPEMYHDPHPSDGGRGLAGDDNPFLAWDPAKCILCGKCVRVCSEVVGAYAIQFSGRGFATTVGTAFDVPLAETGCVFCGNCAGVCPVAAVVPRQELGKGRTWQCEAVETTCCYCGVGCRVKLRVRAGRIVGAEGGDSPVNSGFTCAKGRFGYDFVHHSDRLTTPLVRDGGDRTRGLRDASWDEALELVARRLESIRSMHGADALGVFSSAKCTNEENYLVQKFARAVLGTNNVDHCARLCHASSVTGLARAFGSAAMTNSIEEIDLSRCIFVIGSNTMEAHPVIGYRIHRARLKGATLIVADPRRVGLAREADIFLQVRPGSNIALLNAMMHVIVKEGLHDVRFVEARTEGFEGLLRSLSSCTPEEAERLTGVPRDDIQKAGRAFAGSGASSIFYAMGITQHATGTRNVLAIANLAMLTGNVGRPGTGVNPLRGHNNVQGACDMGALPWQLPGYRDVSLAENRAPFEREWSRPLPGSPGLTVTEMIPAAARGRIKALYVCGENPMVTDPDVNHVRKALENLEFLVVQDIFLTETAALADVVLPGASAAEKEGTFTSTERRVQLVRKAVDPPGRAHPDWVIVSALSRRMGYPMDYESPASILEEISSLVPSYRGITAGELEKGGLQWPCPHIGHPGTKYLHAERFSRGLGCFVPVEAEGPEEVPDQEYPVMLTTGRVLHHFHAGSMTRRSKGLAWRVREGFIEIHPSLADALGVAGGELVSVSSRRGAIRIRVKLTEAIRSDVVFIPFHFAEAAANLLTNPALDPSARIPEFKACAVRVEKLASGGSEDGARGAGGHGLPVLAPSSAPGEHSEDRGPIVPAESDAVSRKEGFSGESGGERSAREDLTEDGAGRESPCGPVGQELYAPSPLTRLLREEWGIGGPLGPEVIERLARRLDVPVSHVYSVASFYGYVRPSAG